MVYNDGAFQTFINAFTSRIAAPPTPVALEIIDDKLMARLLFTQLVRGIDFQPLLA